jgi:hypothetical protein
MPRRFDRSPLRKLPHNLFKTLRNGLFGLIFGKFDKRSAGMETFRPNMPVGSYRHGESDFNRLNRTRKRE